MAGRKSKWSGDSLLRVGSGAGKALLRKTSKSGVGKKRKPNKFGAVSSRESDGFFHSQKELRRYRELQLLERAGTISDLKRQVPYKIRVHGFIITTYIADHVYKQDGEEVVEDVKSEATKKLPEYKMKKALMRAVFGVKIKEVL